MKSPVVVNTLSTDADVAGVESVFSNRGASWQMLNCCALMSTVLSSFHLVWLTVGLHVQGSGAANGGSRAQAGHRGPGPPPKP